MARSVGVAGCSDPLVIVWDDCADSNDDGEPIELGDVLVVGLR